MDTAGGTSVEAGAVEVAGTTGIGPSAGGTTEEEAGAEGAATAAGGTTELGVD